MAKAEKCLQRYSDDFREYVKTREQARHDLEFQRQGKIRCALALLAATAPIEVTDVPDQAASLKFACERLHLIEAVLASTHVIEDAPQLARVRDLHTDAQGIIVTFAGELLTIAKLQRLVVDPAGSLPSA